MRQDASQIKTTAQQFIARYHRLQTAVQRRQTETKTLTYRVNLNQPGTITSHSGTQRLFRLQCERPQNDLGTTSLFGIPGRIPEHGHAEDNTSVAHTDMTSKTSINIKLVTSPQVTQRFARVQCDGNAFLEAPTEYDILNGRPGHDKGEGVASVILNGITANPTPPTKKTTATVVALTKPASKTLYQRSGTSLPETTGTHGSSPAKERIFSETCESFPPQNVFIPHRTESEKTEPETLRAQFDAQRLLSNNAHQVRIGVATKEARGQDSTEEADLFTVQDRTSTSRTESEKSTTRRTAFSGVPGKINGAQDLLGGPGNLRPQAPIVKDLKKSNDTSKESTLPPQSQDPRHGAKITTDLKSATLQTYSQASGGASPALAAWTETNILDQDQLRSLIEPKRTNKIANHQDLCESFKMGVPTSYGTSSRTTKPRNELRVTGDNSTIVSGIDAVDLAPNLPKEIISESDGTSIKQHEDPTDTYSTSSGGAPSVESIDGQIRHDYGDDASFVCTD